MQRARLGHVGVGAAELLHGDVLAGDGLDDVGSGDEHLAGLVDHDHEVGQRGGVHVPAGGGAHDQRDLRDDAGRQDVVAEDPAVQAQRDDALLDARAGAVVDADERTAGLDRQFLDLDDLLAVHLAEAAAEHRGVLAEDAHVAAVDGAVAGDHAVAERAVVFQPEVGAAVLGQRVEFDERVVVQQRVDALARGQLALGVHLLDGVLTDRMQCLFPALVQLGQLARGGVDVDGVLGGGLRGVVGNACHGSRCYGRRIVSADYGHRRVDWDSVDGRRTRRAGRGIGRRRCHRRVHRRARRSRRAAGRGDRQIRRHHRLFRRGRGVVPVQPGAGCAPAPTTPSRTR